MSSQYVIHIYICKTTYAAVHSDYIYTYPSRYANGLVDNLKSIPHHTNMRTPNGEDIPAVNERFRHRLAAEK